MMDEVFGEENRLAIINWQKTTVKNNSKHVSETTEYVLVYAKDLELTKTQLLDRSEKANARFGNPDNDPEGRWKQGDLTGNGPEGHKTALYCIQSPFDGALHPPGENRCWAFEKRRMKEWLTSWGSTYVERDLRDGRPRALVIEDAPVSGEMDFSPVTRCCGRRGRTPKRNSGQGHGLSSISGCKAPQSPCSKCTTRGSRLVW